MTRIPNIFVTVGTQLPFDRLIGTVKEWHFKHPDIEICYVVGDTKLTGKDFGRGETHTRLKPKPYDQRFFAADLIVSHAGMGTIITTAEVGKPIIIMPRRADLGEHRNDHQLATAEKMAHLQNVQRVDTHDDLIKALDHFVQTWSNTDAKAGTLGSDADPELLAAVREFIFESRSE